MVPAILAESLILQGVDRGWFLGDECLTRARAE